MPQKKVPHAKPIPAQFQQVSNSRAPHFPVPSSCTGTGESPLYYLICRMYVCLWPIDFLWSFHNAFQALYRASICCFAVSAEFVMTFSGYSFHSHPCYYPSYWKKKKHSWSGKSMWTLFNMFISVFHSASSLTQCAEVYMPFEEAWQVLHLNSFVKSCSFFSLAVSYLVMCFA